MFQLIEAEMRIHQIRAELEASKVRYRPVDPNAEIPRSNTRRRWEVFRRIADGR